VRAHAAAWLLLASSSCATASAQNLLRNGEFDTDSAPWAARGEQSLVAWSALDHDSCGAASGSALAANGESTVNAFVEFTTCVAVAPGQEYTFGAELRFPTGQDATGEVSLQIEAYGTPDCSFLALAATQAITLFSTTPGVWAPRSASIPASPDTHSVLLHIDLLKEPADDVLLLRFDGAYLIRGTGYLFAGDFETGSFCRWSAVHD